ncbi:MAG: tRNA pseudouridine(55) synthase TruB, partial [Rickettsiales bacterium]|nr:tRNA pseudouridine(55) synthase TruB [Rickettsiales bacterium]
NNPESAAEYLQPIDCGLDGIPVCKLETNSAELFQNGGFIDIPRESSGLVRVYNNDRVIGIGRIENGILKPERVLIY